MYKFFNLFEKNIDEAKNISGVYTFLRKTISSPVSFDDILRSQIVYSVSAFDKLIHDLVRVGMVQIYMGVRQPTPKFLAEPISLQMHDELSNATLPPREIIFEKAVFEKLKTHLRVRSCLLPLLFRRMR